jgi:phosphohistidine phosphatase
LIKKLKTLLILRHAKSSLKSPKLADHDRPLDELARQDAYRLGGLLRSRELVPNYIASSTALRAKSTADLVAEGCGYVGEVVLKQPLYQAKPIDYMQVLERLPDRYQRVLLVGHNPTIEDTIEILTGLSNIAILPCTLAHLNLPVRNWSDLGKGINFEAKLIDVLRP